MQTRYTLLRSAHRGSHQVTFMIETLMIARTYSTLLDANVY